MEARDQLRTAIERWRRSEAASAIARARGEEELAIAWPLRAIEHANEARADLEPGEEGAVAAHLARAVVEQSLTPLRAELRAALTVPLEHERRRRTTGQAMSAVFGGELSWLPFLEERARSLVDDLRAARSDANYAAQKALGVLAAPRHDDAGPEPAERDKAARAWLDGSADALLVVRETLGADDIGQLAHALRLAELDGVFADKSRARRIADRVAGLGLGGTLTDRARVEVAHSEAHPRSRVAILDAPYDVRVIPSAWELGWLSELCAAEGVGRALMHTLVSPSAPVALRRPAVASCARAVGALFVQLLAEPRVLEREGVGRREREPIVRHTGALIVLATRAAAASTLVAGWSDAEASAELERALGTVVPEPVGAFVSSASGGSARFRAWSGALALWHALRERYDEDWYRNPRAAEPIRNAAERGGWLSIETWLGELGVRDGAALARLAELCA